VELNHVTCTFWNSQRTETADVRTSGAARAALPSAETKTNTTRGVRRNHGNKQQVSNFQVAACCFTMRPLRHKFLPALHFRKTTRSDGGIKVECSEERIFESCGCHSALLKIHVFRNKTSRRIINNFRRFGVALTSQKILLRNVDSFSIEIC